MKNKTQIWSICNQKGGCGKTTVSMHLAGELGLLGKSCILIDADAQNSCKNWYELNENIKLPFKVLDFSQSGIKLHHKIYDLLKDVEYILIDCPPAAESDITRSALMISNLALIPFVPSAVDMMALIMMYNSVKKITQNNPTLESRLFCNLMEHRTKNSKQILESVTEFGMKLLSSHIKKRTVYKEVAAQGTIVQLSKRPNKVVLEEIKQLAEEILSI